MKGEPERALSDVHHALALNSDFAEAWALRGVVWFDKQNYSPAIADFDQALKLNPRLADAYCDRGITWLAQIKPDEAEADFARCGALGGKPAREAKQKRRSSSTMR